MKRLSFALAGASLLVLAGCGADDSTTEDAETLLDEAASALETAADETGAAIADAADAAVEGAANAADEASNLANAAGDAAADLADGAAQTAGDMAADAGDALADAGEAANDLATGAVSTVESAVSPAAAALASSRSWLETNAAKAGVSTTDSGLQYMVVNEGAEGGASPAATDTVVVHYEGRLTNGDIFVSSYSRGEPAAFPLNAVIPGWTEGLQLMSVGDKYRLFLPPELAYGERGAGSNIGPNEALVFDVELLEVK